MTKKVIVFLADGFEEVEALTPVDYLRRAGAEVTVAGVGKTLIEGAHGVKINADAPVSELEQKKWDAVIVPGGMPGSSNIAACDSCSRIIKAVSASGGLVAAICAAPAIVLAPLGILEGRPFTCYPTMETKVSGAKWSSERVVADGNLITGRGPGVAEEWALRIVLQLFGEEARKKLAEAILAR